MSEEYKITNMLVTDEDIENIDNNWQSIIDEYLKMYVREKDQVIAQYLMRKQDKEIERLKEQLNNYARRIIKAIKYIEQQRLHKFQDTTGGLTYKERKLLDILDGVDKE